MTYSLRGKPCVLCARGVSGDYGEHVLPQWLLRALFPSDDGPYTTFINGIPVARDDGEPIRQTSAVRFQLPVCPACNRILAQRFEQATTRTIIAEMLQEERSLTAQESATVGEWFVKTWLLLARDDLRFSDPHWKPNRGWEPPPELFPWLTSGDAPPAGLSLWLMRVDRDHEAATSETILLPSRIEVAGKVEAKFGAFDFGLTWLDVSLVYHPGWAIAHPLEERGEAVRLWPPDGSGVRLGDVPVIPSRCFIWAPGGLRIAMDSNLLGNDRLPPLSPSIDFFEALGGSGGQVVLSR